MSNYHRASHRASEERRWGSDYEISKAHAVPSKGTVGVLGRNGQDYDVYSPGNPGYLGSPGHKTPTKTKTKAPAEIADWGGAHRNFGSNLNEVQSRDPKVKVKDISKKKPQSSKVVHVNVSKASPDVQKAIKKTGNDTYTYDNRRSKRK